jgi:hypothetical protein
MAGVGMKNSFALLDDEQDTSSNNAVQGMQCNF